LDTKDVQELIRLLEGSKLSEIEIQEGDSRIKLRRDSCSEVRNYSATLEDVYRNAKERTRCPVV
jgi:hypothetical protein